MTREEAIKDIEENILPIVGGKSLRMAIDALRQPERKKGRWIKITTGAMREKYMCSICGRTIEEDGIERLVRIRYPFCHCGADMTEGEG